MQAPKGKQVPPDSFSETESYDDVGDDALVYRESDMEGESEDDAWFGQLIATSLSSSSITPTEPEDGVPVMCEDQPVMSVPDDSQVDDSQVATLGLTELDSPTTNRDMSPETPLRSRRSCFRWQMIPVKPCGRRRRTYVCFGVVLWHWRNNLSSKLSGLRFHD